MLAGLVLVLYLIGVVVTAASTAHVLGEKSPVPDVRDAFLEKAEIQPVAVYGVLSLLIVAWPATLAFNLYAKSQSK